MALFVQQDDQRSELQKQIASELKRKAIENSKPVKPHDGVEDSAYINDLKSASKSSVFWIIAGVIAVIAIIWLTVMSATR